MIGRVVKVTGTWNLITHNHQYFECRIKGKLKLINVHATNPIAVGDYVEFETEDNGNAIIKTVLPRKNYVIRKSINLSKKYHILASNIDQTLFVWTYKNPTTLSGFLDRFLVTCEAYKIPVIILFNKIDDLNEEETQEVVKIQTIYENIGYKTLQVSSYNLCGINELKGILKDKTSLFFGNSGVGKSTLINTLAPEFNLKTNEVSQYHSKGQHTTTFAQMYPWSFGGDIIDIPGVKEFGLIEIEKDELGDYFPEILKLKEKCKFNNCLHLNEPKCAIIDAVKNGEIHEKRYGNYLKILNSLEIPIK